MAALTSAVPALCQSAITWRCMCGMTCVPLLPVWMRLPPIDHRNLGSLRRHAGKARLQFGALRRVRGVVLDRLVDRRGDPAGAGELRGSDGSDDRWRHGCAEWSWRWLRGAISRPVRGKLAADGGAGAWCVDFGMRVSPCDPVCGRLSGRLYVGRTAGGVGSRPPRSPRTSIPQPATAGAGHRARRRRCSSRDSRCPIRVSPVRSGTVPSARVRARGRRHPWSAAAAGRRGGNPRRQQRSADRAEQRDSAGRTGQADGR